MIHHAGALPKLNADTLRGILSLVLGAVASAVMLFLTVRHFWADSGLWLMGRVAKQFLAGNGWLNNVVDPVHVFTSPLWMMLLTVGEAVAPGQIFVTALVLSVLCVCVILGSLAYLYRSGATMLLAVVAITASWGVADHLLGNGLETALSCALTAVAVALYLRRAPLVALAIPVGLAMVARHDTAIIVLPLIGYAAWRGRGTVGIHQYTIAAAIALLPILLWSMYAFGFYGNPLPASAVKTGAFAFSGRGTAFWWFSTLNDPAFAIITVAATGIALWRGCDRVMLLVTVTFLGAFYITLSEANMGVVGRHNAIYLMVMVMAALYALPLAPWKSFASAAVVVLICVGLWMGGFNTGMLSQYNHWKDAEPTLETYEDSGEWLNGRFISYYRTVPHQIRQDTWGLDPYNQEQDAIARDMLGRVPEGGMLNAEQFSTWLLWRLTYDDRFLHVTVYDKVAFHHSYIGKPYEFKH